MITDLFESRLKFATSLVPTVKTLAIERGTCPEEIGKQIRDLAGMPLRVALECTGIESSITAAIYVSVLTSSLTPVCPVWGQGVCHWRGSVRAEGESSVCCLQQYPFGYCSANEIDLQFQYRYANQYPKAIRLVSGGLINLKPLVSHRFPLEEAVKAFEVAADPSQGAIKVQIQDK